MRNRKKKKYFLSLTLTLMLACACSCLKAGEAAASDRAIETVYLGAPKHVWWENDTLGKWSPVTGAHEYQVKLYLADDVDRDEENPRSFDPEAEGLEAVMTRRTADTSCDFSEYMNDLHVYFFAVRAVPRVNEQAYVVSGSWIASLDMDFRERTVRGITGGKWRNYLEGSRYEDADGQFLSGGWQLIAGYWYLLDENGFRLTGWQTTEDGRYYLGTDSKMATGWFLWEDAWYYADPDGRLHLVKPYL